MRVVVVAGTLQAPQLTLWDHVADRGIDLCLVGTTDVPGSRGVVRGDVSTILDVPGLPTDPHYRLAPVAARGVLRSRGVLWWHYDELASIVREQQPDVVHVLSEAWGTLTGQALRTSAVVVAHGVENLFTHGARAEAMARAAILRRRLPRLAGYASWNTEALDVLRRLGLPPDLPTTVVPAVLPDPARFTSVPERPSGATPTVAFIGRLTPSKGVDTLLHAAARSALQFRLVVIGSGPEEETLRTLAAELGVQVDFRAAVSPESVPDVLADVDVIAVPSRPTRETKEQFGRIAVEAMWAGRPVVATRCGALPEVIGDAGLLSPVDDADALARNLERLLSDETVRRDLVDRGRRRARSEFAPEVAAERLEEFWQRVVRLPAALRRR